MFKRLTVSVAFALTLVAPEAFAQTQPDTQQQLAQMQQQLAQQQAEIQRLRNTQSTDDADAQTLVTQVMADARQRQAISSNGQLTAGYDKGFYVGTADGNFRIRFGALWQARHIYNHMDNAATDNTGGFEIGRTIVGLSGHVIDPSIQFNVSTAYSSSTGTASLDDAWITKSFNDNLSVTVGQFGAPFWKEGLVSAGKQQLVDRSIIRTITGGGTQGVRVNYTNGPIRAAVSLNDGMSGANTQWDDDATEFAFTGRAEYLVKGDWAQTGDFQSWRGEKLMIVLGGAVHAEAAQMAAGPDLLQWTVDAAAEFGGASVYVAGIGSHEDGAAGTDQYGLLVQGGVFVTDNVELVGRYEFATADAATDDLHIITAGFNYFMAKHAAKLTVDAGYAFTPVNAMWASEFSGWRPDQAGQDGQFVVRSQLQVAF